MDKTAIRNFAIEARKILMKSAITEAGFYGITKDGCKDPVQKGNDFEVYETVAGTENRIFGDDIKRRANLVTAIKEQGFDQVIEETAYTWFNRIIAIRFMEVNNYLPTRVRVLSSETGSTTPDIVTQSDTVELNLSSDELERIQTAKRENRYDDAFRSLFIKQCNDLNAILPGLFEKTDDYMELLLKITYTGDGVIRMLVDSIPEDNFNVETEGQVEIIGWMYQYYNTELKDDTFAKLKKNVKITKERIPAATQLFTPDWIVRYMVENSLGRVWIEHLRAVNPSVDEKAKAEEFGWKYYLPEAEQDDDVQTQLVEIRKSYKDLTPQDITCIDPCMGSGHILVYMFDVLMDIYRSEGFSEREAVFDVLEKNIRGLDIDRRAYQLSYFALMMKAREYNRIFFRGHEDIDGNRVQAVPRVYAIEESNTIDRSVLQYFGSGMDDLHKNNAMNQMNGLLDTLYDAREYGSIIDVDNYDWSLLKTYISSVSNDGQLSLESYVAEQAQSLLNKLLRIGETLAIKYHTVVTNPPYMGGTMNAKLTNYLKINYDNGKGDLFAVFIEKCAHLSKGKISMVTPESWMFLSTFLSLRKELLLNNYINSCAHLGLKAFDCGFGTSAFVITKGRMPEYRAKYYKLNDVNPEKKEEYLCNERAAFISSIGRFKLLPNEIMAYWCSESFAKKLTTAKKFGEYYTLCPGIKTGNNEIFLRAWFEVEWEKVATNPTREQQKTNAYKWYLYNKGGGYRKWFGGYENVIEFENDAKKIRELISKATYRLRDESNYFRHGIIWPLIGSDMFSARELPSCVLSDVASNAIYFNSEYDYTALSFMNSCVFNYILNMINPTVSYPIDSIFNVPYLKQNDDLSGIAKENINISKIDWNSKENAWGFRCHPLVSEALKLADIADTKKCVSLKKCFELWSDECNERFNLLKNNEEKINSYFINVYGIQDELKPDVDEKDISISKADLNADIKSLISYAVGCMFGRYSLNNPGLIYAGGIFDNSKYEYFIPDEDAIIPITDEQYFEDDIVGRLEEFVKVVYGADVLEDNLDYIAQALGTKGTNSRERIRNYFLSDFFKDHCTMYSVTGSGKRPIYWLFDSGKQNGFKCLIYLHRYNPDIVGRIRSDYLTKTQSMIENALKNAEYAISTSSSAVDKAQATKKRDKYIKQLSEIRAYYPALSHIALQRIDLDLDDGVKANYAKFQGIDVSIEGEKKQKVNLLAKI